MKKKLFYLILMNNLKKRKGQNVLNVILVYLLHYQNFKFYGNNLKNNNMILFHNFIYQEKLRLD